MSFCQEKICSVSKLNESVGLTGDIPFSIINVNGKPHIATPLTLLSQNVSGSSVAYMGSINRFIRGIPVRQWRVCTQSHRNARPITITISYSGWIIDVIYILYFFNSFRLKKKDPDKWTPALKAPGYESIPVHMEVVMIDDMLPDVGEITNSYNMFDFRPGLNIREEAYYVRRYQYYIIFK